MDSNEYLSPALRLHYEQLLSGERYAKLNRIIWLAEQIEDAVNLDPPRVNVIKERVESILDIVKDYK